MSTETALPAHASPAFPPINTPLPHHSRELSSNFQLDDNEASNEPPPAIISPAFTPPATPGTGTPAVERGAKSFPVDTSTSTEPAPKLLETLPKVWCEVRARIPTTTGTEMFLYLYKNNVDSKEHLAIVFGSHIRSKSLDAVRLGETEKDRMIRGAYIGRLHPGRTTSRVEQLKQEHAGVRPQPPKRTLSTGGSPLGSEASPSSSSNSVDGETSSSSSVEQTVRPSTEMAPQPQEDTAATNSTSNTAISTLVPSNEIPLVRIHSECYTGETVWSARCDCGEQLDEAARLMSLPTNPAGGVVIYLRQEGRGIGLGEKLKAYNLQDLGHDTYEANLLLRHPADARSYGLATAMLMDLDLQGETGIRLLTNNPDKVRAVEGPNREVVVRERVAMVPLAWKTGGISGIKSEEVEKYLSTKIEKFKHMIG